VQQKATSSQLMWLAYVTVLPVKLLDAGESQSEKC
jgi:hypothetical protein